MAFNTFTTFTHFGITGSETFYHLKKLIIHKTILSMLSSSEFLVSTHLFSASVYLLIVDILYKWVVCIELYSQKGTFKSYRMSMWFVVQEFMCRKLGLRGGSVRRQYRTFKRWSLKKRHWRLLFREIKVVPLGPLRFHKSKLLKENFEP